MQLTLEEYETLKEARDFFDPGMVLGYRPGDRSAIPNWEHRAFLEGEEKLKFGEDVAVWEEAHGHDCRLKCLPEFQCAAIEISAHRLVGALVSVIDRALTEDQEK